MAIKSEELLHIEIAEIDYLLILRIKELRINKALTQLQLSQKMKMADGFVSKVETLTERAKYNIRHLPLLATALGVEIKDLLPEQPTIYDIVKITIRKRNKTNLDGTVSQKKVIEVVKIEPVKTSPN
ncbi:MAG: XRE family transcriptional regulator [Acinetobacter sp.]|nr:MAG: XRE family transcriptional regulator [Acinetobacter sp.]